MAKKNERHHEQVIEVLRFTNQFLTARAIQEVMIDRFGTHVNHTNAIAFHLRLLASRGLIEVRESRCRKEYRWRTPFEQDSTP